MGMGFYSHPREAFKTMELKINKTYFRTILDALKIQAYSKDKTYTERLPYLRAYQDLEYKGKLEERKKKKGTRK